MPKLNIQKQQKQSLSFVASIKGRFIQQFTRISSKYQLSQMVIVLDLKSATIISNLFTMTQLINYKIVFVERLEVIRKPLEHHAIYFITPDEKSIDYMLKDYQSDSKYRKIHVLFTSALDKDLLVKIGKYPGFLKKLSKNSFKEFYYQLFTFSTNCIHLNIDYLSQAYGKECNQEKILRSSLSNRFIDIVSSFQSIDTIKICYEQSYNKIAKRIAQQVGKQLKNHLFKLIQAKSKAIKPGAPDITFYITDRSIDITSPIIHGYAYQALLYDLIGPKSAVNEQGIDIHKVKGQIFEQFRYRHFSHALTIIPERIRQLKQKIESNTKLQLLEIKSIQEGVLDLQIHLQILQNLLKTFNERKIGEIGEIQLCLVTGINSDGKQTSSLQLLQSILQIIKNNTILDRNEKIRLALLTLCCIKLSKEDYFRLMDSFSQEEEKRILNNLGAFGIKYDKSISKSTKSFDKTVMERARAKLNQSSMPSERFTTTLQTIIPNLVQFLKIKRNKNDKKVMEQIVVSIDSGGESGRFDERRFICFMVGGLSLTEICSLKRNKALQNIILASDKIMSPNEFLQSLAKIDILNKF